MLPSATHHQPKSRGAHQSKLPRAHPKKRTTLCRILTNTLPYIGCIHDIFNVYPKFVYICMTIPLFQGQHTFDLKPTVLRKKIDWQPPEAYKIKAYLHEM